MATYTAIPSGDLDPESPITTGLMTALDANVEGALAGLATFDVLEAAYGAGSIPAGAYKALSIANGDVANTTITGSKLVAGTITATQMGTDSVHRDEIASTPSDQNTPIGSGDGTQAIISATGGDWSLSWFAGTDRSTSDSISIGPKYSSSARHTDVTFVRRGATGASGTVYLHTRYIPASPPWNLGHGDIPLFVQLLTDSAGSIKGAYIAEDPPWYGYGPHSQSGEGRLLRSVGLWGVSIKSAIDGTSGITLNQYFERINALKLMTEEEKNKIIKQKFTMEEKNKDMMCVPHLFHNVAEGDKVVMIDPTSEICDQLHMMHKYKTQGNGVEDDISSLFKSGYLELYGGSNHPTAPPGVEIVSAKWKLTGGK